MNIIVIGNGFDLAHGLPTKYTDFLEFVKVLNNVLEERNIKYNQSLISYTCSCIFRCYKTIIIF